MASKTVKKKTIEFKFSEKHKGISGSAMNVPTMWRRALFVPVKRWTTSSRSRMS